MVSPATCLPQAGFTSPSSSPLGIGALAPTLKLPHHQTCHSERSRPTTFPTRQERVYRSWNRTFGLAEALARKPGTGDPRAQPRGPSSDHADNGKEEASPSERERKHEEPEVVADVEEDGARILRVVANRVMCPGSIRIRSALHDRVS